MFHLYETLSIVSVVYRCVDLYAVLLQMVILADKDSHENYPTPDQNIAPKVPVGMVTMKEGGIHTAINYSLRNCLFKRISLLSHYVICVTGWVVVLVFFSAV